MAFSPDDIEIKEFVPTLRGYGREEVRAFLRSVAEDVRRLEGQLVEVRTTSSVSTPTPDANPATAVSSTPNGVPILHRTGIADLVAVNGLQSAITDLTVAIQALASRTTRSAEPSAVTPAVRHAAREEATRIASEQATRARQALRAAQPGTKRSDGSDNGEPSWVGEERRRTGRPWAASAPAIQHQETARDRENAALLRTMIPLVLGTGREVQTADAPQDLGEKTPTNVVSIKRAVS